MSAVFPPVTGSVPACVTSVKVGAQTYSFPWLSAMTCMAGPVTIALSICAEYQNLYYAEIGYSGHAARGAYNNACDREIIWLGAGVKI